MKRVSSQASALVRKSREIANGMFEFGLAFHQLVGQSEGGALGNKLQLMGSTADTISALAANHAEAELRKLEDPFRDYILRLYMVYDGPLDDGMTNVLVIRHYYMKYKHVRSICIDYG